MGISEKYKKYIDPRMEFSDEELEEFDTKMMPKARRDWLLYQVQAIDVYLKAPGALHSDWWKTLGARLTEVARQYIRAADLKKIEELEPVEISEVPQLDTAQFVDEWDERVKRSITVFASKGDKWIDGVYSDFKKKEKTSMCNKILNAMELEIALQEMKEASLGSSN